MTNTNQPPPESAFIDDFLRSWDRFAQGANELLPTIKRDTKRFHEALANSLTANPRWAVGRLVLYMLLQVGGFLPADSDVGRALIGALDDGGLQPTIVKGERMYFAGDLYFWWEKHREAYETPILYDEWRAREFAQTVAIPMYAAARTDAGGAA